MNFPVELGDCIENQKRNTTPQPRSGNEDETLSNFQGNLEALNVLFSRYRNALSLVAYRVLGNHAEAEDAVQNCLLIVSENLPTFEDEGAFRCWLVRVLIDEALTILARQNSTQRSRDGDCQDS